MRLRDRVALRWDMAPDGIRVLCAIAFWSALILGTIWLGHRLGLGRGGVQILGFFMGILAFGVMQLRRRWKP